MISSHVSDFSIPDSQVARWQRTADLLAKSSEVPAALIMRADSQEIEVFISSDSEGNPYRRGERAKLDTGLYCEMVMASREPLLVSDATQYPEWDHNPDIKLGMIYYLGFPLLWPDGQVFGTLCLLDRKDNPEATAKRELMALLKEVIESDLKALFESQKATDAMMESEMQYRQLAGNLNAGLVVYASDSTIIFHNKKASELLGLTHKQLLGKRATDPVWQFLREDGSPMPVDEHPVIMVLSGREPLNDYVVGIDRPDKEEPAWVLCNGFLSSGYGGIEEAVVTFVDISDMKRVQHELLWKTRVFEHAITANSISGVDGTITFANDTFRKIWGYQHVDEVVGRTISDFIKFEHEAKDIVDALNKTGQWEGEYTALKKDGSTFDAYGLATDIKDAAGNTIGYQSSVVDISEKKLAEIRLIENEFFYRSIIQTAMDGYWRIDTQGQLQEVNDAYCRMSGYSMGELLLMNVSDLESNDTPDEVAEHINTISERGEARFETKHRRKGGAYIDVEISAKRIGDNSGVAFIHDITERKQLELEREQLIHDMGERIKESGLLYQVSKLCQSGQGVEELLQQVAELIPSGWQYPKYTCCVISFSGEKYLSEGFRESPWQLESRIDIKGIPLGSITVFYTGKHPDESPFLKEELNLIDAIARTLAGAIGHKISEEQVWERERDIRLLLDSTAEGIYGLDLQGNCTRANAACLKMLGYDDESELIGQNMHELVRYALADGMPNPQKESPAIQAARNSETIHNDEEVFWRKDGSHFPVAYWSYPMIREGQVEGEVVTFMDISEQLQARDALQESHEQLQQSLEGTVTAVAKAVEARDPYTAGHQRRVADLAAAIAAELGLDEERVKGIRLGATIHDIGKIQLPAEILSKPGRLSSIEFQLIQSHPQASYEILKDISFPWPVAEVAHQHHERIDGSGYPQGLKGEDICLEARIVAVADVVEAMNSHRPYRPGLGIDSALEEIREGRGSRYDEAVVDACLKLFAGKGFEFS
ncbi:PAS domain S-box-containing protein/HDIG domain-containing protein [Mariprofundus aestuarium]|uniref:PAS domain S-box-containing protein/HDIG domain-containing protein n=1 Tax=Mariprofundus aestuarium TaxID=1921086 RepID=A0A2K8KVY9_MARES|nr:PAS domain S-box protein [Mariprofundus aestuarium]ATX79008.1 PAS domain S-box-containing protein/HDIG domain-containing protein [Mariprofundus aestuarium]